MIDKILDKAAAECVEELLSASTKEGGERWFTIIRRKMKRLVGAVDIHRKFPVKDLPVKR